ncbi:hypothetical protein C8A00DRAFT_14048 [Chaetomidium leptoderma]|uniref:Uncharacterized protein n=1 Tax=Chaetomidium leptoderma TaxID=669021 RepID=A0AAN6VR73_9PEZI|nr:hypothetical protein C8A00DRAFT_14048 [Chaetomidium leptoderma]
MSGRGRGRPPSRSAQEPAAGASRRSTRQQHQHQQNAAQPGEGQPQLDSPERQLQEQQDQAHGPQPQIEASMAASAYHQNIDPAIAGPQTGGMHPPPIPSVRGLRGQTGMPISRRFTQQTSSIASVNSAAATDAVSSQPEPQSNAPHMLTPALASGTPGRAFSVGSSSVPDTPSREAARAKLMSFMLSRLFTASDDLFTHLCTELVDAEMWEAELKGYKDAFEVYRAQYVEKNSDPTVDPDYVTATMRVDRASPLWDRVFRVVSAANLALLLEEITIMDDQQDLLPRLQEWDKVFPRFFVGGSSDNKDNAMNEQIIEQILMIRTQRTIFELQALQKSLAPFHPIAQVAEIWCAGDVSVEAVTAFLEDNKDALQLKPISRPDAEAAALASERNYNRFVSICNQLPKQLVQGDTLDLSQLHDLFSLEDGLQNLRTFVKNCFTEIKRLLQQGPSTGGDASFSFAASDATSRAGSQIRSQLETDAMAHPFGRTEPGAPPVSYYGPSISMLKEWEQHPPGSRIPYPPGFGSTSSDPVYADPSQQGGLPADGSVYAESARQVSGRKRGAQGEPTLGDDGTPATAAAKRPRASRKKKAAPEAAMGAPSAAGPSSAPLSSVAPSQYPPLPGTQDEPDFDALTQRAREISAASRKVKEPQVRSSWVRKDVLLLVKAVNTYQCKWSTIEKEIKAGTIPFERPRDQQALRDKARLLKQDFLKVDAILPRGFDLVVLGKKEREAVKAANKNPDRKEADVDENGRAISTEYVPEEVAAPATLPAPLAPVEPQPEQQL